MYTKLFLAKRIFAVVLVITVLMSLCSCVDFEKDIDEYESVFNMDGGLYIYQDKIAIDRFELYDSVYAYTDIGDDCYETTYLLEGFIKRFISVDGMVIIEFYDKWYTFDANNYQGENPFDYLTEYEDDTKLREMYEDFTYFDWQTGFIHKSEEYIRENQLSTEFKTTTRFDQY